MTEAQQVWDQALAIAGVSASGSSRTLSFGTADSNRTSWAGDSPGALPPFIGGVQVTLDSKEKHSGSHSLQLTFNGLRNVNFSDVCQYVSVQPSTTYRFSAWVRTHALSTDQGVRFALHSISRSVNSTSWTEDVRGTQPWTQLNLPWTSGRDVQECSFA